MMETVLVVADEYKMAVEFIECMANILSACAIQIRYGYLAMEDLELVAISKKHANVIMLYKGRLHRPTMVVLENATDDQLRKHTPFFHYIGPNEFEGWMRVLVALWHRRHPTPDLRSLENMMNNKDIGSDEFNTIVDAINRLGFDAVSELCHNVVSDTMLNTRPWNHGQ